MAQNTARYPKRIPRNIRVQSRRNTPNMAAIARNVLASQIENKVSSISAIGTAIVTTGNMINVTNNIIQGDDISQRSGTAIKLKRFRLLFRGTASATSASVRFILLRDMFNQGTTPAVSNILPATNWISQYADTREMQQHRFKIITDVMMDLNIAGENVITRQYDIPVKGTVYYNGPAAVSTDNGQGAVFLLVIGNSVLTAYDYTVQTVFTDA